MAVQEIVVTDKALRDSPRGYGGVAVLGNYLRDILGFEKAKVISAERDCLLRAYTTQFDDGALDDSNLNQGK